MPQGRIAAGSDADLLVWDPEASVTFSATTHVSRSDVNVYEGVTCQGAPRVVISRGGVVRDKEGVRGKFALFFRRNILKMFVCFAWFFFVNFNPLLD